MVRNLEPATTTCAGSSGITCGDWDRQFTWPSWPPIRLFGQLSPDGTHYVYGGHPQLKVIEVASGRQVRTIVAFAGADDQQSMVAVPVQPR